MDKITVEALAVWLEQKNQKLRIHLKGIENHNATLNQELVHWCAEQQMKDIVLVQAARCALADLEGIMPEFEPSGDRQHPGWQTIKELRAALKKAGEKL